MWVETIMLTQTISSKHLRAVRYNRDSREILDWHEHHNFSFCFVVKGDYEETTRHRTVICRTGDAVLKTADLRHLNRFGKAGAVCLLLGISHQFLDDSLGLIEPELTGLVQNPQLARIGLELCEELQIADRLSPIMLQSIALRSLISVLRIQRGKSKRYAQVDSIRQSLDRGVALEGLTRNYLTANEKKTVRRLFYEIEGCSINTYALRRRAFRAFDELLNSDRSLSEVALRSGFYDQAHFTKVFARMFGVTPGRLRSRSDRKSVKTH
jgi:AraC family transcriptional regulator